MKRKAVSVSKSGSVLGLLKSMWHQTAPLFSREFLSKTMLTCSLQFSIFVTSNGMYMWFPLILNSMMEFMKHNPNGKAYICDVVHEKHTIIPIGDEVYIKYFINI